MRMGCGSDGIRKNQDTRRAHVDVVGIENAPIKGSEPIQQPALPVAAVTVRTKGDINCAVIKEQRGPVEMPEGVKVRSRNHYWTAKLFCAGGDIESMQPTDKARRGRGASGADGFLRLGHHIDSLGHRVNDRSRGDANFWNDVVGPIRSV